MITETLSLLCGSDLISDSALKVVFSYYPVCRCQRTSRSVHSKRQKNSILIAYRSAFATAAAGKRDKIEPICSPKTYVERTPKYRSLASRGIVKIAGNE